ncbi:MULTISPECIES: YfdX family protein [Cyanophyceae]|jgi:ribosomal protein L22|uniref:YfdX protein n=3 Tax=Cyanophyceae TaxID=3028117 RepID=G6FSX9_9CYAN|nr:MULTISPECIES: YfdX family protein [Cyanophyceae]EHC14965.1 hypothetical protein FJSC11DRAFT_1876 [Fischerella thermalis JSC-11]MCI3279712.1 YfdX family protein [Synechococcus sp. PCC 6717]OKH27153.1 hypothetical protein NIES1031_10640 [Chroogloeocystis siderophila 5.2 s.c.1]PLZ90892.1 hypothetical protein CEN44_09965 [Fischerella muscicola CCMEE 5323]
MNQLNVLKKLQTLVVGFLVFWLLLITPTWMASAAAISNTSNLESINQPDSSLQQEIEKEKQAALDEAESRLDQEAIAAIEETRKAIAAIAEGKTQDALQALERATGKLDILLARYPELGLVPAFTQVAVIDVAPLDLDTVQRLRNQIKSAINAEDFPAARELLNNLMSEIRTVTFNLPLATYPDAMKQAARLLNEKQAEAAKEVLQKTLSTLVITEQARPIPLIEAHTKLLGAVAVADLDRSDAGRLLEDARNYLQLAKELGYARRDPDYAELDQAIKDIQRQLRANEKTASAFAKLQDKFSSFFNRVSEVKQAA